MAFVKTNGMKRHYVYNMPQFDTSKWTVSSYGSTQESQGPHNDLTSARLRTTNDLWAWYNRYGAYMNSAGFKTANYKTLTISWTVKKGRWETNMGTKIEFYGSNDGTNYTRFLQTQDYDCNGNSNSFSFTYSANISAYKYISIHAYYSQYNPEQNYNSSGELIITSIKFS